MGVADMTRTCGAAAFAESAPRCCTPKRCCSSVTTSARSEKATSPVRSACVPTTRSISPAARAAFISRFSFAVSDPVSFSTRQPKGSKKARSVVRCCSARISVGAMKATWCPARMTAQALAAATIVLPLPTSPWISRFIGRPAAISEKT
jgi:hypothetical protein